MKDASQAHLGVDRCDRRRITVERRRDFEDVALTLTARSVAAAALARDESRGCHHRAEYPDTAPEQGRSIVVRLADTVCAEALAAVS